jgi:hypothetical protein
MAPHPPIEHAADKVNLEMSAEVATVLRERGAQGWRLVAVAPLSGTRPGIGATTRAVTEGYLFFTRG